MNNINVSPSPAQRASVEQGSYATLLLVDLRALVPTLHSIRSIARLSLGYFLVRGLTTDGQPCNLTVNTANLLVHHDQREIGFLHREFHVKRDLSHINELFVDEAICTILDRTSLEFASPPDTRRHRIHLLNFTNRSIATIVHDKFHSHRSPRVCTTELIDHVLPEACERLLRHRYPTIFSSLFPDSRFSYDRAQRTETELVEDLLILVPTIRRNFKSGVPVGCSRDVVYAFDHRWTQVSGCDVEDLVISKIRQHVPGLTNRELRHLSGQRNRVLYRQCFVRMIRDPDFVARLDTNQSILPIGRHVVCQNLEHLREIGPEDNVSMVAGWTYDAGLAARYREEVRELVRKILPQEDERRYALTYLASALHGFRKHRCFLILTDKRVGSNGKTTLMRAVQQVFGPFFSANTKFVCRGSMDPDRNAHDAGMQRMRGVRVLCADELKKNSRLDDGLLKALTGGGYDVEGRYMHKTERFSFPFQAIIVLIFNEGDCPQLDATDGALAERMRVVPMRSKFVVDVTHDDWSTLTFPLDHDLTTKLPAYRSALLDLLLEHRDESVLDHVPASMVQWRDGILTEQNPVAEWLEDHLTPGTDDDYITLSQLYGYFQSTSTISRVSLVRFVRLAKEALRRRSDVVLRERYQSVYSGGRQKFMRNVILGQQYVP
jgi:hypothetical protein